MVSILDELCPVFKIASGDITFEPVIRAAASTGKKIILSKDIEAVVALMARIPTKSVNQSDKNSLKNLERDLKNFVQK